MNQDKEEWRIIADWPKYEVSNYGNIRNSITMIVLKPWLSMGYRTVDLCHNGTSKSIRIYNMVAAAFLGPRSKDCDIHHINNIRSDDKVSNLSYILSRKHIRHHRLLLPNYKLTPEDVVNIRLLAMNGYSNMQLARMYSVCKKSIWQVIKRETWADIN